MFLLTNIVAAFVFSAKTKRKKSQMKQVYWKGFLVYLVNAPIFQISLMILNLLYNASLKLNGNL